LYQVVAPPGQPPHRHPMVHSNPNAHILAQKFMN
jgi:hypothetical protein